MKTATRELALIILMMSAQICTLQAACRKSSLTNTLHAYGQPTFQPSDKSLQVAHHQQQQQLSNIRLRRQATTSAHQPVNMKQEIINYSNATSEHITTAHNRTSALNITQEHTAATTPSMNSTQTPATTKHSVARDAKEIDKLRLEYFKFRILSQLGIAHNPDQMAPKLDDGLRRELSSDALLADEAAQQTSVSSQEFSLAIVYICLSVYVRVCVYKLDCAHIHTSKRTFACKLSDVQLITK